MDDTERMALMNSLLPPCVRTMNGEISSWHSDSDAVSMDYRAPPEFCHSEIIIQGGFVTGMIDACMAQCCFRRHKDDGLIAIPTLEIKVSFISPGNVGTLRATAWGTHFGKSTAFLQGELHQLHEDHSGRDCTEGGSSAGRLVATASSTVKLVYDKSVKK